MKNCRKKYFSLVLFILSFTGSGAGAAIRVGVNESPPFVLQSPEGDLQGLSYELWSLISQKLALQAEYQPLGLQDGLDSLKKQNIEVLVGAYSLTPERENHFDFSHSFYSSGFGLAVQGQESHFFIALLKSLFSLDFLMAAGILALVLLAGGAFIWILERKQNPEQFSQDKKFGLWDGFWWSAVTMTTVGYGDKAPVSAGGKVFGLIWMFASIILISGLTGSIAASLAVDSLSSQVTGLESLYNRPVGVLRQSSAEEYLSQKGFQKLETFSNMEEALVALNQNDVQGFFHDKPLLGYELQENPTKYKDIIVLPQTYGDDKYAFVLQQGSKFREKINKAILEILKSPQWERIKGNYGL